jgi:hypothetical protein
MEKMYLYDEICMNLLWVRDGILWFKKYPTKKLMCGRYDLYLVTLTCEVIETFGGRV